MTLADLPGAFLTRACGKVHAWPLDEHHEVTDCWCKPEQDTEHEDVIIHKGTA